MKILNLNWPCLDKTIDLTTMTNNLYKLVNL